MDRRWVVVALCMFLPIAAATQEPGTVRISVQLTGADGVVTPIRRHLLLVSANPASAPPRRVFTAADGTVLLSLPAGNYTVESDQPVALGGTTYQWTQTVDVVAGKETVLALSMTNADVGSPAAAPGAPTAFDEDRRSLVTRWQDSVVQVWTPIAHGSGAIVDAAGLVVTTYAAIDRATAVAVQLTPTKKVLAQVVASDAERDVAVLRIDAATAASVAPIPLGCEGTAAAVASGDEIVALEAPLGHPKGASSGKVSRVATRVIESDIAPAAGGAGGPVFSTRGAFLGIASEGDARIRASGADPRVVGSSRVDLQACKLEYSIVSPK